jgi:RNA polymerase sigma factor (sigma-70 family)
MQNVHVDIIPGALDEALYNRFASTILIYLMQQVANPQDAEDLLLEVFIASLSNTTLSELSPERQLAWLRRVARNKVIDRYRHNTLITLLPLDQALTKEDHALTPEEYAERQESLHFLYQALGQLSPLQQELLRLRYRKDLRFAEIGTILGKTEGAIRKLLARTIRQLHQIYTTMEKGRVQ